jgi:hypothetical protein
MKLSQAIGLCLYFYGIMSFVSAAQSSQRDASLLDMYTAQCIIKNMHDEIQSCDEDFVVEIMVILVGTYEKIVGATVSYCLMMHNPVLQEDLHDEVARILAQDIIKILSILLRQFVSFITDKKITLKEKLYYCALIGTAIIIIKLGVDQLPKSLKKKDNNKDNQSDDLPAESGYVSGKFAHYR